MSLPSSRLFPNNSGLAHAFVNMPPAPQTAENPRAGHGEYVQHPNDIRPAIERAFVSGKPASINVKLKQDQSYKGGGYV